MAKLMERGIELVKQLEERIDKLDNTCYEPVMDEFKPLAKLRYEAEANQLVITKGSIIRLPETTYSTDIEFHLYKYIKYKINTLYENGELKDIGNREYKVVGDVSSRSPSMLAILIKGKTVSGWEFFEGLEKVEEALFGEFV